MDQLRDLYQEVILDHNKKPRNFGTLEAGKVADLIVLNADPLADIRNTLDIDRVMRLGEWVDRSGLVPSQSQ